MQIFIDTNMYMIRSCECLSRYYTYANILIAVKFDIHASHSKLITRNIFALRLQSFKTNVCKHYYEQEKLLIENNFNIASRDLDEVVICCYEQNLYGEPNVFTFPVYWSGCNAQTRSAADLCLHYQCSNFRAKFILGVYILLTFLPLFGNK